MALVELRAVTKTYGALAAVRALTLAIDEGQFVVLLGPSGSGKTTLLSMIGGFVAPDEGAVHIDGVDVTGWPPRRRPTATVFQDYALFPHMSVAGNVGFGLAMHGVRGQPRRERVAAALRLVGLGEHGSRGVHALSGGQRQRVALARAIAVAPRVLLLDEPLGALDLNLRRQMQDELTRIQKRLGTTFVHVTHDQEEAMTIADRIVVMNAGRIEDEGPPRRVYLRPRTRFTATFMGDGNLIEGRVVAAADGELAIDTALGRLAVPGSPQKPGTAIAIMLRPEHLRLAPAPLALGPARVRTCLFQGAHQRVLAETPAGLTLELRVPPATRLAVDTTIEVYAEPADAVVLAE